MRAKARAEQLFELGPGLLCPALKKGDLVLDKLSSHKIKGVRELIAKGGAEVLYLPPYSPDLNPIETCST